MKKDSSIAVIGGGIVGCAVAYELSAHGYSDIVVIERNVSIPGTNQSSTNEGTIHSGIYYPKDAMPLKAQLCVEGNRLLYAFLKKYHLPYKKVGKLIIATTSHEEEYLQFFLRVGRQNGVAGAKVISSAAVERLEPNVKHVTQALYVPSAGCASPAALIQKVKQLAQNNGVKFLLGTKVENIDPHKDGFTICARVTGQKKYFHKHIVINAAGLYADEVARMINPAFPYHIEPTRGEFFQFHPSKRQDLRVSGMHLYQPPYCYQVKNGKMRMHTVAAKHLRQYVREGRVYITAGVHLSPVYDNLHGTYVLGNRITISPLKTTGLGKEDYTTHLQGARDYIQRVNSFFPSLKEKDIQPDHTGIMAPLRGYRDFIIQRDKKFANCIHLVGMESPAWTACFAIARYVRTLMS